MSFAYIDSQGKEVSIPGPDALRLRIGFGAITDSTRFYDEAQDRWGAAADHEIYRQLKRDIAAAQTGEFPPPVVGDLDTTPAVPDVDAGSLDAGSDDDDPSEDAPSRDEPAEDAEEPLTDDLESLGEADGVLIDDFEWAAESDVDSDPSEPDFPKADPSEPDPAEETPDAEPEAEVDESPEPYFAAELDADVLDETFRMAESTTADDDPTADELMWPEGATADELDKGMDTFTLAEPGADSNVGNIPASGADEEGFLADEGDSDDVGFDFGSAGLELEEEELEDEELGDDELAAEVDGPAPGEESSRSGVGATTEESDGSDTDDAPDFGMVFEGGAPEDSFAEETESGEDDLDPEPPASSDADSASDAPGTDGSADRNDPYDRAVRERRGPRSNPPRRRGGGSGPARVAMIFIVVAAVGAGAWYMTGSDGGEDPVEQVVLPALPTPLEAPFRDLTRSASSSMVFEFDSLPQRLALADQPGPRWLSGPYLSSASSFQGVREYWEGFDALLDEMIASEDDLWTTAWQEQLAAADLTGEEQAQLRERGIVGWEAAAPDRRVVYEQLRAVIDASLGLHRFLVENESNITYDPSTGGGAGDPVLEVVPATPELGDQMWTGVGQITVALDALGYVQQVETEPLLEAVKARLVAAGVR